MKKETNALLAGAVLGLMAFSQGALAADKADKTETEAVMCYGVNSCKGMGSCAGKIDACSGKEGCNSQLKCSGLNSCKGKGLTKLSKKECLDKGGKVASK